jgi:hypothetical protein
MPSPTDPLHPIVKAADIDAARINKSHFLNPAAIRQTACLSDMGG